MRRRCRRCLGVGRPGGGDAGFLPFPVVCNTAAYELPETVALLQEVVDIVLPDFKYGRDALAATREFGFAGWHQEDT